jgi:hypothetical protein
MGPCQSQKIFHCLFGIFIFNDYRGLSQQTDKTDTIRLASTFLSLRRKQDIHNFERGTESVYCNTGYNVLAEYEARTSIKFSTEETVFAFAVSNSSKPNIPRI